MTVNGFTTSLGSKTVPVVDAAVAYDCEFTSEVYILIIINEAYVEATSVNLITPFILCFTDLQVNKMPKCMAKKPKLDHHSISVPNTDIILPMAINGVISYLPTRLSSSEEIFYRYLTPEQCIEITPDLSELNQHNPSCGI